ncbi:oxidoreductase-like protein [Trametes elegans]|nr:oxidoreductase-like protein [Trametes elegans]
MSLPRLSRPLARQRSHLRDPLSCSSRHSTPTRRLATAGPLNDPAESPANAPTVDAEQLTHLKRSFRGGQDLSQRHTRLERSVRGKTQYGREILDLQTQKEQHESQEAPFTPEENIREASTHVGQKTQRIFKGLVIPEPPKPPAEDECCMSGCAVCVYDLYDEARKDYVHALDNIRARLDDMGVPEEEWPSDIRRSQRPPEPAARPDVILSAFEQFEKALRERKERERRQTTEGTGQAETEARSEG